MGKKKINGHGYHDLERFIVDNNMKDPRGMIAGCYAHGIWD